MTAQDAVILPDFLPFVNLKRLILSVFADKSAPPSTPGCSQPGAPLPRRCLRRSLPARRHRAEPSPDRQPPSCQETSASSQNSWGRQHRAGLNQTRSFFHAHFKRPTPSVLSARPTLRRQSSQTDNNYQGQGRTPMFRTAAILWQNSPSGGCSPLHWSKLQAVFAANLPPSRADRTFHPHCPARD